MKLNPFQIFNLSLDYSLKQDNISNKYIELQKQFHPDNYTHRSSKEKLMAVQISSNIVDAYKILLDPVKRAVCLINLKGREFSFDSYKSTNNSILFEQIELREKIESLDNKQLLKLARELDDNFLGLESEFIKQQEVLSDNAALDTILRMRYCQKSQEEIMFKLNAIN